MAEHKHAHKKDDVIQIPVGKYFESIRKNPWIIATIVLAVVLIILIFVKSSGSESVRTKTIQENVMAFVDKQVQGRGTATFVSATKQGSLYEVVFEFQGQQIPVYVTADGKYLVTQPIPLTSDAAAIGGNTDNTATASTEKV